MNVGRLAVTLLRAGHVNNAPAAVLGGAVTWIWAAIEKWNTPVKFILSQMALDYRVLELTVLLGRGITSKLGSWAPGGPLRTPLSVCVLNLYGPFHVYLR